MHGGRDHCRNWDWVAQALRDDWHVICPDLRGHGDSQWSPDGNYSMSSYIYDLAQLIHQQGLAPVTIVAHSLGGNICLRYAGIFPDKVRKLVAIEGLGPSPKVIAERRETTMAERMREWVDEQRKLSGRLPRRYPSIEDAFERMQAENPHLSAEQARHLTEQGVNQNEDGTYSWKFDNYVRAWPPYDMSYRDIEELWSRDRLPDAAGLRQGELGLQSGEGRPAQAFQECRGRGVRPAPATGCITTGCDDFLSTTTEFIK